MTLKDNILYHIKALDDSSNHVYRDFDFIRTKYCILSNPEPLSRIYDDVAERSKTLLDVINIMRPVYDLISLSNCIKNGFANEYYYKSGVCNDFLDKDMLSIIWNAGEAMQLYQGTGKGEWADVFKKHCLSDNKKLSYDTIRKALNFGDSVLPVSTFIYGAGIDHCANVLLHTWYVNKEENEKTI